MRDMDGSLAKLSHVAVVGCGHHCESIVRRIEHAGHSGFRAIAVFNASPDIPITSLAPVFDDFDAFVSHAREQKVHEVWLALPLLQDKTILRFVNEFRADLLNMRFIPDVRSLALSQSALLQKAIFDRLFALAALIAVAPLLIGIAIAVKISSPGPVFLRQRRKGADGGEFNILKFRSMHPHTGSVGAFLRRTSLDELPQFFNVLRGDMSIVGPPPHAPEHDDLYQQVVQGYTYRHRIKPGITGWAQINGFRGETDRIDKMEARVAHDLYYLGNWSFALDMRIILKTALEGLRSINAY
ncbi:sugar transferase [Caballeronia temeraria]|uniref:Sugar transferase n=1 Tax=Caballeronia temeraria TaxID=1777137 RepID=A0A158CM73_9BURK|nr:sugar transferase [Caballeronia temeraria]